MPLDVIELVVQGLVTLFFAFMGSWIMWKIAGPKVVIAALQTRLGPILLEWLTKPSFKTGRTIKSVDEEGTKSEKDEILSPLQLIMKEAGDLVYQKLMGKVGGDARKKGAIQGDIVAGLSDPASPLAGMLNGINPAIIQRAIKDGDYVPIIMEQFGPLIQKYFESRINKPGQSSTSGGNLGL